MGRSRAQLDAITKALKGGQDELRQDNAAIQTERDALWASMGQLANYAVLARHLGDGLEQHIADLRVQGKTDDATALESDALFYVRQRHQDLMTQMAVSIQGYLALDVVKKNNSELIKGVDRALDTTLSALRVAVIVAQALAQQKIVLAQIDALNSTTADMITSTSELLKSQGTAIHKNAAKATIDPSKLQQAFDNVFQAMDEIDRYKTEAAQSMKQTVEVLGPCLLLLSLRRLLGAGPRAARKEQEAHHRGVGLCGVDVRGTGTPEQGRRDVGLRRCPHDDLPDPISHPFVPAP